MSIKPLASAPVFDDNRLRCTTATFPTWFVTTLALEDRVPLTPEYHGMTIRYRTYSKLQPPTWASKGMFVYSPPCTSSVRLTNAAL